MKRINDATVETRVSRMVLAELAMFFTDRGERPRSISELLRVSLELLAQHLVNNKLTVRVDSVVLATQALERAGLGALNKGGRGMSVLLKAIQQDELGRDYDAYVPLRRKAETTEADADEKQIRDVMRIGQCSREEAVKQLKEIAERNVERKAKLGELTDEERIRLKDEKLKKGLADEVPEVAT